MNIDTALFFGHSPVHTTCRNPSNRTTVFQCKCVPCISVSFSLLSVFTVYVDRSVTEPPLFWAAPAPDVRGPVADSGSRQKSGSGSRQNRAAPGGSGS